MYSKTISLTRLILEQDSKQVQFTDQSSFPKDQAVAKAAVTQLISGDPNAPIFKAIASGGGKVDPEKAKEWVSKIGPDVLVKRIVDIGNKIPEQGLAKKDMPFLPGPDDAVGSVEDVGDALTPGGKYNVDFKEATAPPAPNSLGKLGTDKNAQTYMTSGHKDGQPKDDVATFKANPQIQAAKAIPTQTNILLPKALSMAIGGVSGGNLGAYLSTKGEILDGHHRWAATMLNNPNATLGGFAAIDLDAMGGKDKALKHLTAIGNALGNKTKVNEAGFESFYVPYNVSTRSLNISSLIKNILVEDGYIKRSSLNEELISFDDIKSVLGKEAQQQNKDKDSKSSNDGKVIKEEVLSTILLTVGVLNLLGRVFNWIKKMSLDKETRKEYEEKKLEIKNTLAQIKQLEKEGKKEEAAKLEQRYAQLQKEFSDKFDSKIGKMMVNMSNVGVASIDKILQGINYFRKNKIEALSNDRKRRHLATIIFVALATYAGFSDPAMFASIRTLLPVNSVKDIVNHVATADGLRDAVENAITLFKG